MVLDQIITQTYYNIIEVVQSLKLLSMLLSTGDMGKTPKVDNQELCSRSGVGN